MTHTPKVSLLTRMLRLLGRCGAGDAHPLSVNRDAPCILRRGHVGDHRDASGLYWAQRRKQWCPACGRELAEGCEPSCPVGMPPFVVTPEVIAYAEKHGLTYESAHAELSALAYRKVL